MSFDIHSSTRRFATSWKEKKSKRTTKHTSSLFVQFRVVRGSFSLLAALADFSKSIELQPRVPLAYLERAVTLMLMGKDDEAEKDFSRVLTQNPEYKTMVENRRAEAIKEREKTP